MSACVCECVRVCACLALPNREILQTVVSPEYPVLMCPSAAVMVHVLRDAEPGAGPLSPATAPPLLPHSSVSLCSPSISHCTCAWLITTCSSFSAQLNFAGLGVAFQPGCVTLCVTERQACARCVTNLWFTQRVSYQV